MDDLAKWSAWYAILARTYMYIAANNPDPEEKAEAMERSGSALRRALRLDKGIC
jgi:hypothetical protein